MEFLNNLILLKIGNYPISLLEFIGTITLLLSVIYAAKNSALNWIFSIFNVSCFFVIFLNKNLYAEAILQCYFFFNSIYGLLYWENSEHKIRKLTKKGITTYSIITILLFCLMYVVLSNIKSANYIIIDDVIFSFNIVATVMLSRRIFENWYVWIFLNIFSAIFYFHLNLNLIAIEYILFLIINFIAIKQWKNMMLKY